METPTPVPAVKAFIVHDGNVLLVREAMNYATGTNQGKYDVVGGKVKPGEHFEDGLRREIREETGLTVRIGRPFYVGEWRPLVGGTQYHIVGIFFECFAESGTVTLGPDHDEYRWIDPRTYADHALIETLIPAFQAYLAR
jgi:8-oxo-dGTP diphosphatase